MLLEVQLVVGRRRVAAEIAQQGQIARIAPFGTVRRLSMLPLIDDNADRSSLATEPGLSYLVRADDEAIPRQLFLLGRSRDILSDISEGISMGKPLMLQEPDDRRIEDLKRRLGARTKVDVVRAGLDLLEREADRRARVARWRRAARAAAASSREVNAEFRPHARLKKL